MAKPFSIQSPEEIAKEYGGNKQRIGEAMQMGIVDPTAGVLAGMFIDRMRSAQMQEQAPQATVAQQVMGGLPPVPPQAPAPQGAPMPQGGGLGALAPQGEAPMPEAPMSAPEQMPMGMAMGGLTTLPVPDDMFDEPTNGGFDDGYANGGLVAFAKGGMTDEEFINYIKQKESRGRDYDPKTGKPLRNRKSGAMYAMQVRPDTAGDPGFGVTPARDQSAEEYNRVGRDYALALREKYGDVGGAMAYNWGPGKYEKWREAGSPANAIPEETRNYVSGLGGITGAGAVREFDAAAPSGRQIALEDALSVGHSMFGGLPREEMERARQYALEELDPATQEKNRKQDLWMALSEMGFRMASSNSPNLLQAIGEAATATLPGVEASKKERKALKNEAVRTLMAVEDVDRKTAIAGVEAGMEIYKTGLSQEELEKRLSIAEREITSRETQAGLDRDMQLKIASLRPNNPSDLEFMMSIMQNGTPEMKEALKQAMALKQPGYAGGWSGGQGGANTAPQGPWAQYQQ